MPFFKAARINSLAGEIPPITSIIKSICGSLTTEAASSVNKLLAMPTRLVLIFLTATLTNSNSAPARDAKSALLSTNRRAICEPTVPAPSIPTLRVFIREVSQTYEICRGG